MNSMPNMFDIPSIQQHKTAKPKLKSSGAYYVVSESRDNWGTIHTTTSRVYKVQDTAMKRMKEAPGKAFVMDYNQGKPIACKGFIGGLNELIGELKK